MKELNEFSIGDMYWNDNFQSVCTVTEVNSETVSYYWKSLYGNTPNKDFPNIPIEQAEEYRRKLWHPVSELTKALL